MRPQLSQEVVTFRVRRNDTARDLGNGHSTLAFSLTQPASDNRAQVVSEIAAKMSAKESDGPPTLTLLIKIL